MFLLESKEFKKKTTKVKKKKTIHGGQGVLNFFTTCTSIIREGIRRKEEFGSNWYQEKTRGLLTNVVVLYIAGDEE
jgi:hypothetical protein